MQGIYTTSVNESTIDESPIAYKPMKEIIENIKDTVDIVKIIKPYTILKPVIDSYRLVYKKREKK